MKIICICNHIFEDGWHSHRVDVYSMPFNGVLTPNGVEMVVKGKFNEQSALIGQVLCLGAFANGIGSMYYVFLHAKGRTDLTAKLHLVELPMFVFFLILLFRFIRHCWRCMGHGSTDGF